MPPPAAQAASPPFEPGPAASLEDASARLEAALARLEALVETGPFQSERFRTAAEPSHSDPVVKDSARVQALEAAAAAASQALGHAVAEVRQILETDGAQSPEDETLEGGEALDPAPVAAEDPKP